MNARSAIACFIALGFLVASAGPARGAKFEIDTIHSTVLFRVLHMGISNSWGRFNNISGTIEMDQPVLTRGAIDITVKADSVDTGMPKRDEHLRNPDFFAAKQFPDISFKSQSLSTSMQPGKIDVQGILTLHGISKPLNIQLTQTGAGKGPMGDVRAGYETSFHIKRSEFGMNKLLEGVGDDVLLIVSLEVVQK